MVTLEGWQQLLSDARAQAIQSLKNKPDFTKIKIPTKAMRY